MLFLGYEASKQKVELVTDNYYDEELKYQSHINKVALTDSLHARPEWQVNGDKIAMMFPENGGNENIKGNIHFYCPSDEKRDFDLPFTATPQRHVSISSTRLRHGTYKMQIDWRQGKSDFYTEGVVTVQ
jgi:hypothetical protein